MAADVVEKSVFGRYPFDAMLHFNLMTPPVGLSSKPIFFSDLKDFSARRPRPLPCFIRVQT